MLWIKISLAMSIDGKNEKCFVQEIGYVEILVHYGYNAASNVFQLLIWFFFLLISSQQDFR